MKASFDSFQSLAANDGVLSSTEHSTTHENRMRVEVEGRKQHNRNYDKGKANSTGQRLKKANKTDVAHQT
jgi:hypothetical protein